MGRRRVSHERAEEHGLSHLIEHMAFKGTERRSARRIAEDIENVGGDINAATSAEQTSYTPPGCSARTPTPPSTCSATS